MESERSAMCCNNFRQCLHLYNAVLWPCGENRQLCNYSNSNCVVSIEVSHLIVHLVYLLWTLFGLEFEVRPSEL